MITARLQDIAQVRTGYTFRKAEFTGEPGELRGLHISDLRHGPVIDPSALSAIRWQGRGQPPLLAPGELVLAAKGARNQAALFPGTGHAVVPSSQFLVLTVRDPSRLSPEFLCWILSYPATQRQLAEHRMGSKIPSISKKAVQGLAIPLPPVETQQSILRLNRLWEEEAQATEQLLANRATQLQGLFQTLLDETHKRD